MFRSRAPLFLILAVTMVLAGPAAGTWTSQTNANTPVSTATDHAEAPQIVKGPNNGTFVLWSTQSSSLEVYLQFVDSNGDRQAFDALVTGNGWDPVMVADGSGGVIVAWIDANHHVQAQRFDSSLAAQWTSPAQLVSTGDCSEAAITTDGAGGAIVSWTTKSSLYGQRDIHAQRVDASGSVLWNSTTGFVVVDESSASQIESALAPGSAAGSAFVVWEDGRAAGANSDIWIRYIDPAGSGSWALEQAVTTAVGNQTDPKIVADGSGGVVVAWRDDRVSRDDLYAQRVSSVGARSWAWTGVHVGRGVGGFDLGTDGSGGAVLAWTSGVGAPPNYRDIRFQRIQSGGTLQWGTGTTALPLTSNSSNTNQRVNPALYADGTGGAVIAWNTASQTNYTAANIHAQYVDSTSGASWSTGGLLISNATDGQYYPDVVSDGECPAKIVWSDYRNDGDPYIQRVRCPGIVGKTTGGGVWLATEAPATLQVDESGEVGIVGGSSGDGPGIIGPGRVEIAFDRALLRVLEILPGSIGEFEATIDEEGGYVLIETFTDVEIPEGEPLFRLVLQGVADGSSVLAFTGAELGEETYVTSSASVVRVGHGGEEGRDDGADR